MDAGVLQPLIDILVKVNILHIILKALEIASWVINVIICKCSFSGRLQSTKGGCMGDHKLDQWWHGTTLWFLIVNLMNELRCLKSSTCAARVCSSPSAICSPPRMTRLSASSSMVWATSWQQQRSLRRWTRWKAQMVVCLWQAIVNISITDVLLFTCYFNRWQWW